jgi:hypothetical protein
MATPVKTPFVVYFRRWWARLPITILVVGGAVLAAVLAPHREQLRKTLIDTLPSTMFVFGIMVGLASYPGPQFGAFETSIAMLATRRSKGS